MTNARVLSGLLVAVLFPVAVACSSAGDTQTTASTTPGGSTDPGGGGAQSPGTSGAPGAVDTSNPIAGIAPVKALADVGGFSGGAQWSAALNAFLFTLPLGDGWLLKMSVDGQISEVRKGSSANGTQPIGNALDRSGRVVTTEAKRLTRMSMADAGAGNVEVVATTFTAAGGGAQPFDSLKDVAVRGDGNMYATDPGYFATNPVANRLYRVTPQGVVQVVEEFADIPRPNGVALSPDEKTVYVSFTSPITGQMPFVRKYPVNADGTLGTPAEFYRYAAADAEPESVTCDSGGNVYIAAKGGVDVFKADGSKIGSIPVPQKPTGVALGGGDKKMLFITTQGTQVFTTKVNVAGK